MSVRSVIVRLEAEVAGYVAGFGKAAQATDDVVKKTAQAKKSIADNHQAMDAAGKTMLTFGTASVAGLGASTKAAMDWESAWAGVTKTVDGTPEQMSELESSLRGLAKTLPATHDEIAGVAEAAGQLGVKREDVVGFTETMIALGETTNLTADEAATSIAQISNVMGTMAREGSAGVERFSATLVALGNAGASTEKEILEMAKRLAGAGKLIGASESDVLAMANAMASVGIEAQLGGGVMSRVMQRMYADVLNGGKGLESLAKVAGVSSKQFASAFETDPVRAVDMLVKGLSRVKDEGGNVMETMDGLGIKGTEETSVILRLAGAGDLLSDSLKLGDEAWKSNSALAAEAAKRYETTESKVKVAWNNIKDAAIDGGAAILPVLQGAAEAVSGLAQMFGDLPEPVQGAVTTLAAITGGAALLGGGLLTVIPKIRDTKVAFSDLAAGGSKVPGTFIGIGKAAGIATAAYAALATAAALSASAMDSSRTKTSVTTFSNALTGVAANGEAARKALDGAFEGVLNPDMWSGGTTAVNDFEGALSRVFNPSWQDNATDFTATLFGQNATSGINAAKDAIGNYDKALASMATSGNFEDAAAGFKIAVDGAEKQGKSTQEIIDLFPEYRDAVLQSKLANGEAQLSQDALAAAMLDGGTAAQSASGSMTGAGEAASGAAELTEEMSDALADLGVDANGAVVEIVNFTDALINAGLLNLSARDAARGFQEALDAVTASVAENGTTLDINTEKGRANQEALDAVAGAGYRVAQANAAHGGSEKQLQTDLQNTYDGLVAAAKGLGQTGSEAQATARKILEIPPGVSIQSWMSGEAKRMAESTGAAADAVDGKTVNVYVNTHETTFQRVIRELSGGAAPVGKGTVLAPERAAGGDLDMAPGPKGVDSQLFWGAKGEHVLTDREVDLMGGQQAVYRFRSQLRAGNIQGFANGGGIGTRAAATQLMVQGGGAPNVSLEGMTVLVTNPFTGEQVRGMVATVAQHEAAGAVASADKQSQYSRVGGR